MLSFTYSFSCMPCSPNAQFAHLYNALFLWLYHEKRLFCLLIFIMCGAFSPPHMGGLALPPPKHLSKDHRTLNIKFQEGYLISTKSKGAGNLHSDSPTGPGLHGAQASPHLPARPLLPCQKWMGSSARTNPGTALLKTPLMHMATGTQQLV